MVKKSTGVVSFPTPIDTTSMDVEDDQFGPQEDPDLFRDLDVDLIDLFARGSVRLLFDGLSDEERNVRIDELNILLNTHLRAFEPRRPSRMAEAYRRYVYRFYLFGLVPIPIVRMRLLWKDHSPDFRAYVVYVLRSIYRMAINMMSMLIFCFTMFLFSSHVVDLILRIASYSVLLPDMVADLVTYLLRNSTQYQEFQVDIRRHRGDRFYFVDDWEDDDGAFDVIVPISKKMFQYWIASKLNVVCANSENVTILDCIIDTNSLLFRFEAVIRSNFPSFVQKQVSLTTLAIYVSYAVIASVIAWHVMIHYVSFWLHRPQYNQLFVTLFKNMLKLFYKVA